MKEILCETLCHNLSFETVGVGGKFAASSRAALASVCCRPRKMTDMNKLDAHIEWEIPDTWGMLPACACFRHYASDLRIHIHKTCYSYIYTRLHLLFFQPTTSVMFKINLQAHNRRRYVDTRSPSSIERPI